MLKSPARTINVELVPEIGLFETFILQQIHFWSGYKGRKEGKNIWVRLYNTELLKELPLMSRAQFYRALRKIKDQGLLLMRNKSTKGIEYSVQYDHKILQKFPLISPKAKSHGEKTRSRYEKTKSPYATPKSHDETPYIEKATKAKKAIAKQQPASQREELNQAKAWYEKQDPYIKEQIDEFIEDWLKNYPEKVRDPNILRWYKVIDVMQDKTDIILISQEEVKAREREMFGDTNVPLGGRTQVQEVGNDG